MSLTGTPGESNSSVCGINFESPRIDRRSDGPQKIIVDRALHEYLDKVRKYVDFTFISRHKGSQTVKNSRCRQLVKDSDFPVRVFVWNLSAALKPRQKVVSMIGS
jgi:hypothetical protein